MGAINANLLCKYIAGELKVYEEKTLHNMMFLFFVFWKEEAYKYNKFCNNTKLDEQLFDSSFIFISSGYFNIEARVLESNIRRGHYDLLKSYPDVTKEMNEFLNIKENFLIKEFILFMKENALKLSSLDLEDIIKDDFWKAHKNQEHVDMKELDNFIEKNHKDYPSFILKRKEDDK